jgi:transporter family protein
MKDLSSDTALAVRTSVVFTIVMANAFILKNAYGELQQAPAKNLIFLAISGITTSFSRIFYYRALKEGQVSYVASIDKAGIVVTLLLSFLILKEPVTAKVLLGAGFILTGMAILVWK